MKGVVIPLGVNKMRSDWFPGYKKRDPFYTLKTYFNGKPSHYLITL